MCATAASCALRHLLRGEAPCADAACGSALPAGPQHVGARAAGVMLRMLRARARARVLTRTSSARLGWRRASARRTPPS